MKKICSILILIVLLLNSSVMVLISEAVEAVSEMLAANENNIQTTQQVALEKYINYANELERGTMVQLKARVGIQEEPNGLEAESKEEIYLEGTTVQIECPKILEKVPTRVEVIGKEAEYANGIITIKEAYEEKLKYDGEKEYTIILFYDADCYTDANTERVLDVKMSVSHTIANTEQIVNGTSETEKDRSVMIQGEIASQIVVTENVGTIVSVDYDNEPIYNGYINSNIANGTSYDTEYKETAKIMISNKNIAEKFEITSRDIFGLQEEDILNNNNLLYKSIVLNGSNLKEILGENGEIRILNQDGAILDVINSEVQLDESGDYTHIYAEQIQNIRIEISNIAKEGVLEINTTKIIKSTLGQNIDKVKTTLNIIGTGTEQIKTIDEASQKEVISEETKTVYTEVLENTTEIQEATEKINLSVNKQELTNNVQQELTMTATLEKNSSANKLFENPTVLIEFPEEVEKIILKDVQLTHDVELQKEEAVVETNSEGKKVIRIPLIGKQTQYTQTEDISKGTNILVSATVMLKQNIESKVSTIKMICNENTYEQPIKLVEKNNVVKVTTTPQEVEGTVVNSNGLKIDTKTIVGDKILSNNETIYEQQIIKYEVKITNTTDNDIENIRVLGKIPQEMTLVNLVEGTFYNENYEFIPDETTRQKELEVGTILVGQTVTHYYEVKVNDLLDTEEEKNTISEIKVYIGENEISTYTLTSTIKQANIAVELKGVEGRNARLQRIYFAKISNISDREQRDVTVNIPLSENLQISEVSVWGKEEGEYEKTIENNNILIKFNNIKKLEKLKNVNKEEVGGIGFEIEENEVGIYIVANVVNIEENNNYSWNINTVATVTGEDGNVYKSNENRASGYIESVQISQTSDKSGETLEAEEEITYTFAIRNVGKLIEEWGGYTTVNLKNYIPNDLEVTSIKYNTNIVSANTVNSKIQYTVTPITMDINGIQLELINQNDNTENARINLDINIKSNDTAIIEIKAKAKTVYKETTLENYAIVTGDYIKTKKSNIIKNTIKANKVIEEIEDPEEPVIPVDPVDPIDPIDPDDPTTKKYIISGVAWLDENENGQREATERRLAGIEVSLLDLTNNRYLQDENGNVITKVTNDNGQYAFDNLPQGHYYVTFKYDNKEYELTAHQKVGISSSLNSDAMQQETTINNEKVYVGITDTINLTSNREDIDIGLVKNKIFDLKLDKYIQKITVQNSKGTKEYNYNNEKIAKIEIPAKQIVGSTLVIEYKIVITNVGELVGTVNELVDEMPLGLEFKSELNSNWYKTIGNNISNTNISTQEIAPGEKIETTIVLTKTLDDSISTYKNKAAIGISDNIKHIEEQNTENNSDEVDVIVSIQTGTVVSYIGTVIATFLVIAVMLAVVLFVMKKATKGKGIKLFILLVLILTISPMTANIVIGEDDSEIGDGYINISRDPVTGEFNGGQFHCESPGLAMCDEQHPYHLDHYEILSTTQTGSPSYSANVSLDKTQTTIQYKEVTSTGGVKSKVYGPFKMTCTSNGGPSYSLTVMGIKENSELPENIDYTCIDVNGNNVSLAPGVEFYLKVPLTVEALTSVKVTASVYVTYSYTATAQIKYFYVCEFKNICAWCASRDKQTLSQIVTQEVTESGSANATSSVEWTTELPKAVKMLKLDSDDKSLVLPNIKFILRNDTLGRYVKQDPDDLSITYVVSKEDATTFITDSQGVIQVEGLQAGAYTFIETENPYHGYDNIKNINENRKVTIPSTPNVVKYKAYNKKMLGNINIEKVNNVNSAIKLSNVEFVLLRKTNPDEYIKVQVNGQYQTRIVGTATVTKQEYTTNLAEATVFVTDANGRISINNLELSAADTSIGNNDQNNKSLSYILREINNPHYGYEVDGDYITWVATGTNGINIEPTKGIQTAITVPNGGTINVTAKNEQKYVRLSGYVWEDRQEGKDNLRDDIYRAGSNDKLVEGIKVVLHGPNGASYETWTNSKGEYLFGSKTGNTYSADNILLRNINSYYVEFIYNGMKYTNVIPQLAQSNGSKAVEYTAGRTAFNNKFSTIVGSTEKGSIGEGETQGNALDENKNTTAEIYYTQPEANKSTVTYTEKQEYADANNTVKLNDYYAVDKYHLNATTQAAGYGLGTTYVVDNEEITNINLGIYAREQVDLAVSSDVEDLHVALNGYTHTYHYATRNQYLKNDGAFNVGVKFGDKYLNRYTRTIYQSSVSYFAEDRNNNKLEVNIVYKITMKNESSSLAAIFNKINNYYDKEYTPQEVYYMTNGTKTPITNWKVGDTTYANGELNRLEIDLSDKYVSAGATSTIYIRYRVSDEAVLGLLNADATLDNMTEISAYSTFTPQYAHYASIDEDSAPMNVVAELDENERFIKTTFEDDTDMAPSIVLQADKNNIISGTVFEDSQTQESQKVNERLGNGIYDQDRENVVVNAKVELLEVYDDNDNVSEIVKGTLKRDSNGEPIVAKLYQSRLGENGTVEKVVIDAVTHTDKDGNYQLIGIIPDGYAVRYTYGEGTQIRQLGTEVYKDIDSRDYKSTIITSPEIMKALNIQPTSATIEGRGNYYWNTLEELDSSGNIIRYSDAVDEIVERMSKEDEDDIINNTTAPEIGSDMKARTASFIVGVEFENINGASNVYYLDTNGNYVIDENTGDPMPDPTYYTENKNIDFGIILRPVVDITLDKNITNLSIQLANGQMLVSGNPYTQNLPFTKAIEDDVYIDMDSDLIQGAALNIDYEVKLINASEVDYKYTTSDTVGTAGRRYYWFGDKTGAQKIDKYVKRVSDYLDNEVVYDINEMNKELEDGWEITTAQKLYDEGLIEKAVRDALIEGKYTPFTTEEFDEKLAASSDPTVVMTKAVNFKVSKLLGAKDELVFSNDAEILELWASARRSVQISQPGNLIPQKAKEPDEDSVRLIIMPPTGGNDITLYIITATCSLLLVAVGIILIKKLSGGRS
ncbi:MAG: hypothetical protein HFJ48_05645 [Clostridia bacterium]|nr:hypothetical protein [Clostridia bacterium]